MDQPKGLPVSTYSSLMGDSRSPVFHLPSSVLHDSDNKHSLSQPEYRGYIVYSNELDIAQHPEMQQAYNHGLPGREPSSSPAANKIDPRNKQTANHVSALPTAASRSETLGATRRTTETALAVYTDPTAPVARNIDSSTSTPAVTLIKPDKAVRVQCASNYPTRFTDPPGNVFLESKRITPVNFKDGEKDSSSTPLLSDTLSRAPCNDTDSQKPLEVITKMYKRGKEMTKDATYTANREEVATSLMNDTLIDGCLILGQDDPECIRYITRYRIDRNNQRKSLGRAVLTQSCLPCCLKRNATSFENVLWAFVRSEMFLIAMQICVLGVGVAKESLDLRSLNSDLYFVYSLAEVILTTVLVSIRVASVWTTYYHIKEPVRRVQHVDNNVSVRGRGLRRMVLSFIVLGGVTVIVNLILFVILYQHFHLGWTILTNNLLIMLSLVSAHLFTNRFSVFLYRVREDDHKVALYESVLLLQEAFVLRSQTNRTDYYNRLDRYLSAFVKTSFYRRPKHIQLLKEYVPDWEYYESDEVITTV